MFYTIYKFLLLFYSSRKAGAVLQVSDLLVYSTFHIWILGNLLFSHWKGFYPWSTYLNLNMQQSGVSPAATHASQPPASIFRFGCRLLLLSTQQALKVPLSQAALSTLYVDMVICISQTYLSLLFSCQIQNRIKRCGKPTKINISELDTKSHGFKIQMIQKKRKPMKNLIKSEQLWIY